MNSDTYGKSQELIVVLENPHSVIQLSKMVESVIRLGADRLYVVDNRKPLPDDWKVFYYEQSKLKSSSSNINSNLTKRFNGTHECFDELLKKGFVSIAATTSIHDKEFYNLDEVNYADIEKLAIWFGSETGGISEDVLVRSNCIITVPTVGFVEVINTATLISQVLYEVSSQTRKA